MTTQKTAARVAVKAAACPNAAQGTTASPCTHCKAMYFDTAPADVFDRMQEQSRQQMREACALISEGQKPCMKVVAAATEQSRSEVIPHARAKVIEALEVIECAALALATDEAHGLRNLAEWLDTRLAEHESDNDAPFSTLAGETASVLAVLALVNEKHDSILLHAAHTVLTVACQLLDDVSMVKGGAK